MLVLMLSYSIYIYVEVWGNTFETYLSPLFKLQEKLLRLISNYERHAPSNPLLKKLNVLPLNALYAYSVQLFMYKL